MKRDLLTGATGYVGGRLCAELERRGIPLRCFARRPEACSDGLPVVYWYALYRSTTSSFRDVARDGQQGGPG